MVLVDSGQGPSDHVENKYGYLLQPIRDMTKNWNIDLAHELEDFLEELSHIQVTFDGGKTTMNFAEAALLIQGSACVYSRKVDYLCKLNYEVMELILHRKKSQRASIGGEDGDGDGDVTTQQEREDEFLALDDCEPGKNTLMKVDDVTINVTTNDIPRTPKILVKISDTEKNELNALLNRKGEVIANSSDFKMNTSLIHGSACMLLDASHISLYDLHVRAAMERAANIRNEHGAATMEAATTRGGGGDGDGVGVGVGGVGCGDGVDPKMEPLTDVNGQPIPQPEDILADVAMDVPMVHDDDGDDADVSTAAWSADVDLGDAGDVDLGPVDMLAPEHVDKQVPNRVLRERTQTRQAPVPVTVDYWKTLDPHSDADCSVKPFVQGKSKSLTINNNKKAEHHIYVDEICGEAFYSHSLKKPNNPKKVPKLAAFETLFWKHFKKMKRASHRKRQDVATGAAAGVVVEDDDDDDDDDEENDLGVGAVIGSDDVAGLEDDDDVGDDGDVAPVVNYDDVFNNMEQVPLIREMNFSMLRTQENGLSSSPGLQTYEDLVRAYVDSYMTSVQEYALITDLSKRVAEWEDKMMPKIEEEDEREPFDIHVYGTRVLAAFVNKKDAKTFKKVASCAHSYQVARLFAATLQLANQYNVEIQTDGDLDQGMDTMTLRLLSTKRHHEELETYKAPSVDVH